MRRFSVRFYSAAEKPTVKIKFDKSFKYAGAHSFILYGVANAEQHFFVDADKDGRIKRLYWVQFESYLPTNDHKYDYKSPNKVMVGGLEFFSDAWARNVARGAGPPNSDGEKGRAFLESKGFRLASNDVLMQRLVHVVDASNRDELMIIYVEDLGGTGMTAADLNEGGASASRWGEVSKGLLERALKGMELRR